MEEVVVQDSAGKVNSLPGGREVIEAQDSDSSSKVEQQDPADPKHREAWVKAVGRSDITFDVSDEVKVCSKHFVSGKPAYGMMDKDPDWAPTLHLNKEPEIVAKPKRVVKKRQYQTEENSTCRETWRPPVERPKITSAGADAGKESPRGNIPIVDENPLPFEDFFRNALKASLDSCVESDAQTRPPSNQSSEETPQACENCSRLEERILELEERLATPQHFMAQWTAPLSQTELERPSPDKASPQKHIFNPA
ncbi:hypothetical protein WMY93_022285 [Mugilogobius chulae]|uniref:THAP-type domain-containing protein n=1 Tax=Mugilogobius chulae TaxID=88201 RepID=A0AAW0N9J7_9GOBI